MDSRYLLVSGSRSLADSPAATAWARAQIREAIDAMRGDDTDAYPACWYGAHVITGDAPGPDTWALEAVLATPGLAGAWPKITRYGLDAFTHGEGPGPRMGPATRSGGMR